MFKEILLCKTDPELINAIVEKRGISEDLVKSMMRHDSWTVLQFCSLTGKAKSTINNLIVRGKQENLKMVPALNICYPFPHTGGQGHKHIVRDEFSMAILKESLA